MYFVGERPLRGKWSSGDEDDEGGEILGEPLDELSVGGKHSGVRINWDGEEELPEMRPGRWQSFCSGAGRFITTGRMF